MEKKKFTDEQIRNMPIELYYSILEEKKILKEKIDTLRNLLKKAKYINLSKNGERAVNNAEKTYNETINDLEYIDEIIKRKELYLLSNN